MLEMLHVLDGWMLYDEQNVLVVKSSSGTSRKQNVCVGGRGGGEGVVVILFAIFRAFRYTDIHFVLDSKTWIS